VLPRKVQHFERDIGLHAVGEDFAKQGKTAQSNAIFEMEKERYDRH
jgi:hypothetical protein